MFFKAGILYGSSIPETAATQNCGRPRGISLTSLRTGTILPAKRRTSVGRRLVSVAMTVPDRK